MSGISQKLKWAAATTKNPWKANTCAFPLIPTRAIESTWEGNEEIWKNVKEYEWLGKQWKPLKPTRKEPGWLLCGGISPGRNYSRGIRDVRHPTKTTVGSFHNNSKLRKTSKTDENIWKPNTCPLSLIPDMIWFWRIPDYMMVCLIVFCATSLHTTLG